MKRFKALVLVLTMGALLDEILAALRFFTPWVSAQAWGFVHQAYPQTWLIWDPHGVFQRMNYWVSMQAYG